MSIHDVADLSRGLDEMFKRLSVLAEVQSLLKSTTFSIIPDLEKVLEENKRLKSENRGLKSKIKRLNPEN